MTPLLRPVCWIAGHRWRAVYSQRPALLQHWACRRCGYRVGSLRELVGR